MSYTSVSSPRYHRRLSARTTRGQHPLSDSGGCKVKGRLTTELLHVPTDVSSGQSDGWRCSRHSHWPRKFPIISGPLSGSRPKSTSAAARGREQFGALINNCPSAVFIHPTSPSSGPRMMARRRAISKHGLLADLVLRVRLEGWWKGPGARLIPSYRSCRHRRRPG